ncbi:MAG: D-alanyl-D-alanine carboxypeptidase/D-alanyl-D-alanine-endopeptidase [Candidatus Neomarinimicrobiota bacterium]
MKKLLPLIYTILTSILLFNGCSQSPAIYQAQGHPPLSRSIKKAIDKSGIAPNLGVKVVSLESGKTLYQLNSDHLFTPASNNKIYSSVAALHYLGTDYRFLTTVWIKRTEIYRPRVSALVLKGDGDPDLSLKSLDSLAAVIAGMISFIDTLIIDNTTLDSTRWGEGWMWDEGDEWYAAQIDAMSLNDNCIDIDIAPDSTGLPPRILINPPTGYVTVFNQAVTVNDTTDLQDLSVRRRWWERSNNLEITGELLVNAERDTLFRNIDQPARFTGQVFREMLTRHGVTVTGPTVITGIPEGYAVIANHVSEPLPAVVKNFLKVSDNLTGELLVKTIGMLQTGQQGNWRNGLTAVKIFLSNEVGIDTTGIRIADGSGVSRYNLTSPDQLIKALTYAYHNENFNQVFLDALPIAGVDGTLEERMQADEVREKILAKTGTLSGASSLSGFAFSRRGEPLVFSIMMNGYVGASRPYRRLQDEIGKILATY